MVYWFDLCFISSVKLRQIGKKCKQIKRHFIKILRLNISSLLRSGKPLILTSDTESRRIEVEVPSLDIGIAGVPLGMSKPFIIALLAIPLIEDGYVATFVRGKIGAATPGADAEVGADGIHQLSGGAFYDEEFTCVNLFSHFI